MSFSHAELMRISGPSTYKKGEEYFKSGLVDLYVYDDFIVKAIVSSSSSYAEYEVELSFQNDWSQLDKYHCDCPSFMVYNNSCKHVVATLLELRSYLMISNPGKIKRSDAAAAMLLNTYINSVVDNSALANIGHTTLEPVLEYEGQSSLSLFFRVGEKRMYIVNDLNVFKSRLNAREKADYGKNYSLWHSPAAFCEQSRPLVDFFMRCYGTHMYSHSDGYRYSYSIRNNRNMPLSPHTSDELFGIIAGNPVSVRDDRKTERVVETVREDFCPSVQLKKINAGATLRLRDKYRMLKGEKSVYILTQDKLYCCSEEFSDACGELLATMLNNHGNLFFAEKDITVLFSNLLNRVEPYINLEVSGDFQEYEPLPLVTRVYLDSLGNDSISARMFFNYGDKEVKAFRGKMTFISFDIAGEVLAETVLLNYFDNKLYEDDTIRIENDPDKVYRLLTEGLDNISQLAEIYTTEAFRRVKVRPAGRASAGVRVDAGLLQLNFGIEELDLKELPEILASYRKAKKYHRLRDGSFLMLEENALSGLSELAEGLDLTDEQLTSGHAELTMSRAPYLDSILRKNEEIRFDRDQYYKRLLRDMNEVENADYEVPDKLRNVLRNYQSTGFRWLKTIAAYGFGGILADDMGLGKTLQVLALLEAYKGETGEKLPSIVVCPSSLALNWESEASKFTPGLSTLVIIGTAPERKQLIAKHEGYDLLVTSYDSLKRDIQSYAGIKFEYIIIDEAQYIKNQRTQNAKAVKALDGGKRFALTGTPIENSLAELWSIFDFLMPGYLFSYGNFKKNYETPIVRQGKQGVSERLRQLVGPFMLRRLKKDVLKELPEKTETTLYSQMEGEQWKVYLANMAQVKQELGEMAGLGAGQEKIKILAALTRLRQICCDPALLYENYSSGSAKLTACMELVDSCIQSGHRLLLFSQFTSMLDIIQGRLDEQNTCYHRIDGSTKPSRRLDMVNDFNAGDTPVFLISLKAGGTGLNLTGADVVIHYDPWWNLSAQNQATDRAYRIGQKKSVQVYKLIAKDSIEERIQAMQEKKAGLADAIIKESDNPFERLTVDELMGLFEG